MSLRSLSLFIAAHFVLVAGPSVSLTELWSTPLFHYTLPDNQAKSLNAALLDEAERLRSELPHGGYRATMRGSGWRSSELRDLHLRGDLPAMQRLVEYVNNTAQTSWKSSTKSDGLSLRLSAMWMIMLSSGDSNAIHRHANAMLSGVYWVNAPWPTGAPNPTGSHLQGKLTLRDPRPQTMVYEATGWHDMGAEHRIDPTPGRIVLWPSWLEHSVEPVGPLPTNLSALEAPVDALRVAISFNFELERACHATPQFVASSSPPPLPTPPRVRAPKGGGGSSSSPAKTKTTKEEKVDDDEQCCGWSGD